MWKEIKQVWIEQLVRAKDAWKECWYDVKGTLISAFYAIANFVWAILESVVFLPIKTGIYETGSIIVKYIIDLIKRI